MPGLPCTKCRHGHVIYAKSSDMQSMHGCIYSLSVSPFLSTADFGDFNRYDSQEFLQKFVLFPIVSASFFMVCMWNEKCCSCPVLICVWHQHGINPASVFSGLDPGWTSAGRGHSEGGSSVSVLQVSSCLQHQFPCCVCLWPGTRPFLPTLF